MALHGSGPSAQAVPLPGNERKFGYRRSIPGASIIQSFDREYP
jgi:hypothetical protein